MEPEDLKTLYASAKNIGLRLRPRPVVFPPRQNKSNIGFGVVYYMDNVSHLVKVVVFHWRFGSMCIGTLALMFSMAYNLFLSKAPPREVLVCYSTLNCASFGTKYSVTKNYSSSNYICTYYNSNICMQTKGTGFSMEEIWLLNSSGFYYHSKSVLYINEATMLREWNIAISATQCPYASWIMNTFCLLYSMN